MINVKRGAKRTVNTALQQYASSSTGNVCARYRSVLSKVDGEAGG